MIEQAEPLLVLLSLVDGLPFPPPATRRGRPDVYAERLILKGVVVMLVHQVWTAPGLLALLPTTGGTFPVDGPGNGAWTVWRACCPW